MRLAILALAVLALAIALVVALRRPAPPPRLTMDEAPSPMPERAPPSPTMTAPPPIAHATPSARATPPIANAAPSRAPEKTAPPMGEPSDAGLAAWRARSSERDYAYWDMKLNMLRKIETCVGDKLKTLGAAEVNFYFKKQDGAWLADRAEVREPTDEERAKMGAVDFRGADRELAQRCISEAFAGTTMPITGGTDSFEQYDVHGQIMFPTSADRAWQQTGVTP